MTRTQKAVLPELGRPPQLVGVIRFKLNHDLATFVKDLASGIIARPQSGSLRAYHSPKRRIRDRLSEQDIAELVAAFKAGTAKWKLAKKYGIGIKSVKRLLREAGTRGQQHGRQL